MTDRCLAAHTSLAPSYPPFLNSTQHENGDVTVTVRGAGHPDGRGNHVCGQTVSMRMTAQVFGAWLAETAKAFRS